MPSFSVSSRFRVVSTGMVMAFLALLTLLAWSLSSPAGSSPDDDFHTTSIWCGWGTDPVNCASTGDDAERSLPFNPASFSCFSFKPTESAACQAQFPDRSDRTTMARGNYTHLYPPVYYGAMRTFVGQDYDHSVLRIRIVNSVVAVSIIGLLALMIPASLRRPLLWGFLASCVPLGLFIIPSTNPSSWAVLSAGTLWIAYYAAFAATGWRRRGLVAFSVLALLMGSGSRGDACFFSCLAVVVVYTLRWGLLRANRGLTLLGGAMMAVSAAFFLTSDQSDVATAGLPASPELLSDASPFALAVDNLQTLPHLLTGMFGSWGLGWLDTYTEPVVFQSALLVFGALVFLGMSHVTVRKTLAVSLVTLVLITFPLFVLVQSKQLVGQSVQPRYLLPLVVMLVGLTLLPAGPGRFARLTRPQTLIVVAALGVAQSLALHTNIRRYVTGVEFNGFNLNASREWWWDVPVDPMTTWIIGSLAFATLTAMILTTRAEDPVAPRATPGQHRGPATDDASPAAVDEPQQVPLNPIDEPVRSPDGPRAPTPSATAAATAG